MDFVLRTPSLQHLATVKIIASLWNQRDIWTEISETFTGSDEEIDNLRTEMGGLEETDEWKSIEKKVAEKVSALQLPETCKKQLLNVIKPLGIQVLNWCMCYYYEDNTNLICLIRNRLSKFRWTFLGTVDYKTIAEIVVRDEQLDIVERYKLACLDCLRDDVRELILRIPEDRKKEFINNFGNNKLNIRQRLIASWTFNVDDGEMDDPLQETLVRAEGVRVDNHLYCAFEYAVSYGNRGASDYFFDKASQKYAVQLLLGQFGWRGFFNLNIIAFHVWTGLGADQQERLCQMDFGHLLKFFLCWPYQPLFVEMVKRGKRFMKKQDYFVVTHFIGAKNGLLGYTDYDYSGLFAEFWGLIPEQCKRRILDDRACLVQLLETKCRELITAILNEASARQLEMMDSSYLEVRSLLMDESVVADKTLIECKRNAATNSSNYPGDEEKMSKLESLSRLVDSCVESRNRERRKVRLFTS